MATSWTRILRAPTPVMLVRAAILLMMVVGWASGQARYEPRGRRRPDPAARRKAGTARVQFLKEEPREAFTLKRFDETRGWLDPKDQEERDRLFHQYFRTAYDRAVPSITEEPDPEGAITVRELAAFTFTLMDIDQRGMEQEEVAYLHQRLDHLKRQEGLWDEDQVLHFGYLSRGKPLKFFEDLHEEMFTRREQRRLAGMAPPIGGGRQGFVERLTSQRSLERPPKRDRSGGTYAD